jgi:hypothetical protein
VNKINEEIDPKIKKRMLTDLKVYCDEVGADYSGICQQLGLEGYDKFSSLSTENINWLDKNLGQGLWEINKDNGKIDSEANVTLSSRWSSGVVEIPEGINFGVISGNFNIYGDKINNTRGFPDVVQGNMTVDSAGFTDLKGFPKIVERSIKIDSVKSLTSLERCPEEIKQNFIIQNCPQLKSLEGGPKKVGYSFECTNCGLTTLVGGPVEVGSSFDVTGNQLSTLEGFPKTYNGMVSELKLTNNQLFSLEGIDLKKIPNLDFLKKNLYPSGILRETAMKAREFESWIAAYLWLITTEKFQRMSKNQRDPIREMLSGDKIRYKSIELSKIWKDDLMKDPAVKRILTRAGIMDRSGNFVDSDFEEFGKLSSDMSDLGF